MNNVQTSSLGILSLISLALVAVFPSAGRCEQGLRCRSNDGCPRTEFCEVDNCTDEWGFCQLRPEFCPDVWDPVCGCDGRTYSNACYAARSGVSVDYEGECEEAPCWGDSMCDPNEYCFFEDCDLEVGICESRPEACPDIWQPVCGCDGRTYSNDCYAAMAGMSVDYPGACMERSRDLPRSDTDSPDAQTAPR